MIQLLPLKSKFPFLCILPRLYVSMKSLSIFFVLCLLGLYFGVSSSSWDSLWSLGRWTFFNSTSSSSSSSSILRSVSPSISSSSSSSFPTLTPSSSPYFTYLPHSGWHNQRIALENALTLTLLLNRSLVLPPLLLPSLPWHPNLTDQYALLPSTAFHSWFTVFNLSLFPILFTWPCPPTFTLSNTHRYGYQFTDQLNPRFPDPPFLASFSLHELNTYPYVQLGSLFGSQRLKLLHKKHLDIQAQVQTQLTHVLLTNETKANIKHQVERLGGANQFISLHVRGKDVVFAARLEKLILTMLQRLRPYDDQLCKTLSLFLATDLASTSSSLLPLYQTYPCLYQLTNASLLIDMHVASESQVFLGTQGSTFSKFIQRAWWLHHCHDVLPSDVKCRKHAVLL